MLRLRIFVQTYTMKCLGIDLESTGLDTGNDRIVEVGCILRELNGAEIDRFERLVNPGIKIPVESSAIHGIRDEDVIGAPPFVESIPRINQMIEACDVLVGYNIIFDLKLLMAEYVRNGKSLNLEGKEIWDPKNIFHHHEPRDLSAAMRFYCGREIEGAHRAGVDIEATLDVFESQLQRYSLDTSDEKVKKYATVRLPVDSNGAFAFHEDGTLILTFGKFRGASCAQPLKEDLKRYLNWMCRASFPSDTKAIAAAVAQGEDLTPDTLQVVLKKELEK